MQAPSDRPGSNACSLWSPKSSSSPRRLRVISTYIYWGQLFKIQAGCWVGISRSRGPRTAESCPPPTLCRCQQNPPPAGRAALAPKTTPGSTKTQPGLPRSGMSLLSTFAEPALPTSLALWRVYSQFLPPVLPVVHPQPLGQGSPAPNFHPAFTPEPSATWQAQRGSTMLWRRQLQVQRKTFQLATGDIY